MLFLTGQYKEYFGIGGPGSRREGLIFGHSAYASTFYVITSFHGCHVFAGVCYLTIVFISALMGKYDNGKHSPVELVGLFWHFVDFVWILVFTFIYLIPDVLRADHVDQSNRKEYFIVFAVLGGSDALEVGVVYAGIWPDLLVLALVGLAVRRLPSWAFFTCT